MTDNKHWQAMERALQRELAPDYAEQLKQTSAPVAPVPIEESNDEV